nr:MAG TPA: hypothetical protein [Caudoviricetes sp.]
MFILVHLLGSGWVVVGALFVGLFGLYYMYNIKCLYL